MNLKKKLFNNTRKPEGFLGKMMLNGMNKGHAEVSDWGISKMPAMNPAKIVDLGCGGGRTMKIMLKKFPQAHVTGLDYSEVSVEKSRKINRKAIAAGRCQVVQGEVSKLTFEDGSFQLATAFETVYFWPGPLVSFQQVYRILEPGGTFMLLQETDGHDQASQEWAKIIDGMRVYDEKQLTQYLRQAGFQNIRAVQDRNKHRLCIFAQK